MRRASVMGIAAVAMALALGSARAETPTKTHAPKAASPAPAPAGEAVDDGIEPMSGPDAWDLMDMGPAGLRVDSGRGHAAGNGRRALARRQELLAQLDLTPAQRDKIDSIHDRQHRAEIDQRAKLEIARLDLRVLLRADKTDRGAVDAKIDEIARMQGQMRKSQIGGMLDVRAVLTPEQQQKLRSMHSQ